jgi:hypothetical protein
VILEGAETPISRDNLPELLEAFVYLLYDSTLSPGMMVDNETACSSGELRYLLNVDVLWASFLKRLRPGL